MQQVTVPDLLWYGGSTTTLEFPDGWEVTTHPMRGADEPALTDAQIAARIAEPIGSPPLHELARGRERAVIVFDDMTRPTRVDQLGPPVVDELLAGGIREDDITFVCALGSHGALTQHELRKKVGSELLERFRVYNHNCYENCVEVGTTSRGTPVKINREVTDADLKVGLGTVTAHAQAGFSGGGKIILPGVAHIDTIAHYHIDVEAQAPHTTGLANWDENVLRLNIAEAATMVGLDFKVDVLVNERGEACDLLAGAFPAAHDVAVERARDHYATDPRPEGRDVMVSNAFCKPNEAAIGILIGVLGLKGLDGTIVILADAPEGQVVHYLLGRFGRDHGGRQWPISALPGELDLIIQTPYPDRTFGDWFANPEIITWSRGWDETLELLRRRHGDHARVGVVPNATMAYHRFD